MSVYIPSMARTGNLEKIVAAWLWQPVAVNLVVAENEAVEYAKVLADVIGNKIPRKHLEERPQASQISIVPLPRNVAGMGAIRRWCVLDARKLNRRTMIMSDDDIMPDRRSDVTALLMAARAPGVLGIGCVTSYHDLLLGEQVPQLKGLNPIFCSSGYGFRMFGINIQNAISCGNFDPLLDVCFEDAEFMRQGIVAGKAWYLHPRVRGNSLGKRHEPGGIAALTKSPEERAARTLANHQLVYQRWPQFTSMPGSAPRFQWKRFLSKYRQSWREEMYV